MDIVLLVFNEEGAQLGQGLFLELLHEVELVLVVQVEGAAVNAGPLAELADGQLLEAYLLQELG